jgi:hypothetical protein
VKRWTDDIKEDDETVKGEFEFYLEDMSLLLDAIGKIEEQRH